MKLEINERFYPKDRPIKLGGGSVVLITPPLDEDYWLARVSLGDNAVVCFPKFGTIGIGFQKETDWNTNLPYSSSAETIWNHIQRNKADHTINRKVGIAAIELLREYAKALRQ